MTPPTLVTPLTVATAYLVLVNANGPQAITNVAGLNHTEGDANPYLGQRADPSDILSHIVEIGWEIAEHCDDAAWPGFVQGNRDDYYRFRDNAALIAIDECRRLLGTKGVWQ